MSFVTLGKQNRAAQGKNYPACFPQDTRWTQDYTVTSSHKRWWFSLQSSVSCCCKKCKLCFRKALTWELLRAVVTTWNRRIISKAARELGLENKMNCWEGTAMPPAFLQASVQFHTFSHEYPKLEGSSHRAQCVSQQ